jgi:hypothetical protein
MPSPSSSLAAVDAIDRRKAMLAVLRATDRPS